MMKLSDLLKPFGFKSIPSDLTIMGLQNDSRHIKPGDLFIAYPGLLSDGRQYIQQAITAGAVAVIYDPEGFSCNSEQLAVAIPKLNGKLAEIASRFYDNPSRKLPVTGVTGTNGKTTIAYQLAQAYGLLGTKAAYIGTLGQGDVQTLKPLANTTPDALCIQQLLYAYHRQTIQQVCMEVSSHALSLGRVDCIDFKQAIYTNLSLDHLDFHGTMKAYAEAKARLFANPSLDLAIINQDDKYAELMQQAVLPSCRLLTYGFGETADVRLVSWDTGMLGSQLHVTSPWGEHTFHIQSLGRFNLYNSLAILTSLLASDVAPAEDIVHVMSQLRPSPGRMEIVSEKPCVIVDFAHTPDALENVLQTLSVLKKAKIWVVFGCGGDRDRGKRPIMGRIASEYADQVILTNDNPRTENPETILADITQGIPCHKKYQSILDRRIAIEYALSHATADDIILIAGKGHENYQIIGKQKYPFSDQAVVLEIKN